MSNQTTRLHNALAHMNLNKQRAWNEANQEIEAALSMGADPNAPNEQGLTPLNMIAANPRFYGSKAQTFKAFDGAVEKLLNAGADPLQPGCTILEASLTRTRFIVRLIKQAEERGGPFVYHNGETPLHKLAQSKILILSGLFKWNPFQSSVVSESWINQTRTSDGSSALHILWNNTPLNDEGSSNRFTFDLRWMLTSKMLNEGADVFMKNIQGESPASLMVNFVEQGGGDEAPIPWDWYGEMKSKVDEQRLQSTTSAALSSKSRRL